MLTSISVLFAIKNALNSSRNDAGQTGWWQLSNDHIFHSYYIMTFTMTLSRWTCNCGAHSAAHCCQCGPVYFLRNPIFIQFLWVNMNTVIVLNTVYTTTGKHLFILNKAYSYFISFCNVSKS